MADRAAETGAAAPPRDCASSECPAEAVGTERRRTEREEDGEEEKPGAGGPDGSEPKRRESGARAESAEKGHESGDGACGSTAEKRGEPRDGAPVGGGERKEDVGGGSLDEFVKTADNGALRKLVKVCKKRYCAVSNRAPRQDRDVQAEEVLKMAEDIARRECMRGEPWYKKCL